MDINSAQGVGELKPGMDLKPKAQKAWINMNARIPTHIKRRIKTFCASKNLKIQEFILYAVTHTLDKYDKEMPPK